MIGFITALMMMTGGLAVQERQVPSSDQEVIVTGVRNQDEVIKDFVGALTAATTDRQISRFEARQACPAALGLSASQAQAVVARLRSVAKAAGVPLAGQGCKPNVLVIVARDKKALLQRLARERRTYFPDLTGTEIRRMIEDPGAAAAWQLAGPALNADGVEMPQDRDTGAAVNRTTVRGSRITAASRPQFAAAAVVIDDDALIGLTTTQLADYAAMRTFARTDPTRLAGSRAPTILTALDAAPDSQVPVTMTEWDFALLRGLYSSTANLNAPSQRSEIAKKVRDRVSNDR